MVVIGVFCLVNIAIDKALDYLDGKKPNGYRVCCDQLMHTHIQNVDLIECLVCGRTKDHPDIAIHKETESFVAAIYIAATCLCVATAIYFVVRWGVLYIF
jgi:hypothetical protein